MPTFKNTQNAPANLNPNDFAPTGLDIDQWLDACVSADMTYAILTVKHHDGFVLYPTAYAVDGYDPYSIAQTTWYANNGQPDIVGLFVAKCRERNLNPCLYFSIVDKTWEVRTGENEETDAAGYLAMIESQLTELLTDYGDITAMWFDGWGWEMAYQEIPYATIYNFVKGLQPNCLVIENSNSHPTSTSQVEIWEFPIVGSIPNGNTRKSEEVDSIYTNNPTTWFWNEGTLPALRSASNILSTIANANENSGTYLLAIQPTRAGVLPNDQVTRLGELGT